MEEDAKLPTGHALQAVELKSEKVPAEHTWQAPEASAKEPAAQLLDSKPR